MPFTELATESYCVPSRDPGIELYVRNIRPKGLAAFSAERTVLFIHGATYPSDTVFDLKIGGVSWMDSLAAHGYDVYCMDVRGYGRSTRPPEMDQPPDANAPIVTTDDGVTDFGAVVAHILRRRQIPSLNVIGWSWGTVIAGAYAAQHADKIGRLVFHAPLWLRRVPGGLRVPGRMGAYRTVTLEAARQRWLTDVAADKQAELIPPGVFDQWWGANMDADPIGARMSPPAVRAPNGLLVDAGRFWEADRRYYDPSLIRAPVLLVVGDWDVDTPSYMAQAILTRLTNAPRKRLIIIGEGTHHLMLERNRLQLFQETQLFLNNDSM